VLVKGAETAKQAMQDLMATINGARGLQPALKAQLVESGKNVVTNLAQLVTASKGNRLDPAAHDDIAEASHSLNTALEAVVKVVNNMPDGKGLFLHAKGFGVENTSSEALNEAAEMIKQAMESLPTRAPAKEFTAGKILSEEELQDCLVHYARAIAEATYDLVEGASEAERESARDPSRQKYKEDQTWANGLASASQHVAGCVTLLVRSANLSVAGKLDEENLIAHAKQVASSVKQLVVASGVRAVTPKLQSEISESAKQVVKGTTDIVTVAQSAGELNEKRKRRQSNTVNSKFGANSAMIQKLEQQAAILRLEKQLEQARQGLGTMNQNEYKK